MSKIILPIKKVYSDKIFSVEKKYEYRKSLPKTPVETVLVYESAGCGKIVGEFSVTGILDGDKIMVYRKTKAFAGIEYRDYINYFEGYGYAIAYVIGEVKKYDVPKELSDFELKAVPQNFVYVD